jgi:hypothetical protein
MKTAQKAVLFLAAAAIVAMIAYPPFHIIEKNGTVRNMGFSPINDPPDRFNVKATVNVQQLAVQILAAGAIGAILAFALKDKS